MYMVHVLNKNADIFLFPLKVTGTLRKGAFQPERETRNDKSRFILTFLSIRIFQYLIFQWLSFQVIFLSEMAILILDIIYFMFGRNLRSLYQYLILAKTSIIMTVYIVVDISWQFSVGKISWLFSV